MPKWPVQKGRTSPEDGQSETFQIRIRSGRNVAGRLLRVRRQEPGGSRSATRLRLAIQLQGPGAAPAEPRSTRSSSGTPLARTAVVAVAYHPRRALHVAAALSDLSRARPDESAPGSGGLLSRCRSPPAGPAGPRLTRNAENDHPGPPGADLRPGLPDRTGGWVATVGGDASVRVWEGHPIGGSDGRLDRPVGGPRRSTERVMTHLDPVEALAITPDGSSRGRRRARPDGVSPLGRLGLGHSWVDSATWPASVSRASRSPPTDRGPGHRRALRPGPVAGNQLPTARSWPPEATARIVSLWELDSGRLIDTSQGTSRPPSRALAFSARRARPSPRAARTPRSRSGTWREARPRSPPSPAIPARSPPWRSRPDGLDAGHRRTRLHRSSSGNVPSGRYLDTLDAHKDVVDALAFRPRRQGAGLGRPHGHRSGFWDVAGRSERTTLAGVRPSPFRALAIAPDGKTIWSAAGDDGSVRRWDLSDGKVVSTLRGGAHAGPILALAFGPGGKTLATGGADRELKALGRRRQARPRPIRRPRGQGRRQIAVSARRQDPGHGLGRPVRRGSGTSPTGRDADRADPIRRSKWDEGRHRPLARRQVPGRPLTIGDQLIDVREGRGTSPPGR